jgi:hypothetical protein
MAFPPKKPTGAKKPPFEMSRKDKEPKGMKEGSRREEAMDRRQASKGRKGC